MELLYPNYHDTLDLGDNGHDFDLHVYSAGLSDIEGYSSILGGLSGGEEFNWGALFDLDVNFILGIDRNFPTNWILATDIESLITSQGHTRIFMHYTGTVPQHSILSGTVSTGEGGTVELIYSPQCLYDSGYLSGTNHLNSPNALWKDGECKTDPDQAIKENGIRVNLETATPKLGELLDEILSPIANSVAIPGFNLISDTLRDQLEELKERYNQSHTYGSASGLGGGRHVDAGGLSQWLTDLMGDLVTEPLHIQILP